MVRLPLGWIPDKIVFFVFENSIYVNLFFHFSYSKNYPFIYIISSIKIFSSGTEKKQENRSKKHPFDKAFQFFSAIRKESDGKTEKYQYFAYGFFQEKGL
jgi:hypothetical protein